jgi:transcriptional regulator with XRE-family HTH domain
VTTPEAIFGAELRKARKRAGISQQELSFRADVHWTYVSQLERGLKSPSLGVMFRLAAAIGESPAALVGAGETELSQIAKPAKRARKVAD